MSPQQTEALKFLAIGAPLSELDLLAQKVTAINSKHGPFDACVIVGDLFKADSDGSELDGVALPVPTYWTVGKNALPQRVLEALAKGPEVAPNLVYLGKSSVFTTAQGLKIAVAGGVYDPAMYESGANPGPYTPVITQNSIAQLLSHKEISGPSQDSMLEAAKEKASALPPAFHGVDIFITTSPPPSLSLLSPSFPSSGISLATAAPPLAELVKLSRPRYLFWADGEGFWEREPFGWPGGKGDERWTRAVKLGAVGAVGKGAGKPARWFYATSLPPQTPTTKPPVRPGNASPNPFTMPSGGGSSKRQAEDSNGADGAKRVKSEPGPPPEDYTCKICNVQGHWIQDCPQKASMDPSKPPPGYVCNICKSTEHYIRECPQRELERVRGPRPPPAGYVCKACGKAEDHYIKDCPVVKERDANRNRNKKDLGPAECWFCLSNPKVTKHLIVGIGSETYVTLPKGQLIPTHGREKPLVPGGGHVLIIPIAHHPTLLSIPAADAMEIITEIESYKSALRQCYAQYSSVPVFFEVGRLAGRGGHAHVQVVPVPSDMADKVFDAFTKAGESYGLNWEDDPERALSRVGPAGNYFKVECPDGRKMVHLLRNNFDLQFGRKVLAGLLDIHDRGNWQECVQSDAEDKEDAHKFKAALKPFLPK
ncbi:hypothetical protein CspHIS471_0704480 [Cutaneotrichosporon sp. HIS471]|nr:hypothetical protein CspHIS471_0704480 [Cutaneotrichosporon sp. HIS471]